MDFCQKYRFEESEKKSLPHFIGKLKEKKQTDQQQNQAFDAVSIFFELEPVKDVKETNPFYEQKPQLTHSSWVTVYNDLKSEIKIRHYSPNTLSTYTGWTSKTAWGRATVRY